MNDSQYLDMCCELAERGRGTTVPNPMVGAVIADHRGVISVGWHEYAGGPHAEAVALAAAGVRARGATLYVNLEPCRHRGRTPPCTEAIIAAGISRVVVGERDPNPKAAGGIERLREAGLEIAISRPRRRIRALNLAFRRWLTGQPLLTWKFAVSLDGKTAASDGSQLQLSGQLAFEFVHRLRARHDAVIVGKGTVLTDDPRLTVRWGVVECRPPRPVVFDSLALVAPDARLLSGPAQAIVITTAAAPAERRRALAAAGAQVVMVPSVDGRCDPRSALAELAACGIQSALFEGGGELAASLLAVDAVDGIAAITCPIVVGGRGPTPLDGPVWGPLRVRTVGRRLLGPDQLTVGYRDSKRGDGACSQDSWSPWDRSLACRELLAQA